MQICPVENQLLCYYMQLQIRQMYKININATYFENNFKRIKQTKQGTVKPKYILTEQQKEFIQMYLPKGYRLNVASQIDEKRNRTPRKADLQFQTQYFKRSDKLDRIQKKQYSDCDKKVQKREQRKEKQKSIVDSSKEQQKNKKKYEEQQNLLTKQKQSRLKENIRKQQQQISFKKVNENKLVQLKKQSSKSIKIDQQKQIKSNIQLAKKQNELASSKKQQKNLQKRQNEYLYKPASIKQEVDQHMENNMLNNQLAEHQKQFGMRLINKLKNYKSSWPFRLPVDPITQGVPNYLEVIHEPMDLKTIQKKINTNKYEHISEIHGDINKIFLNSYKFNPRETNYYTLTVELEAYYHEILKQIQTNPSLLQFQKSGKISRSKITTNNNEQQFTQESPTKKKKPLVVSQTKSLTDFNNAESQNQKANNLKQSAQKLIIDGLPKMLKISSARCKSKFSQTQKKQLVKKIHKISSKALQNIVNIAFGQTEDQRTTFYLDLQKLSDEALTKIDSIIKIDLEKPMQESKNNSLMETKMSLF